MDNSKIVVIDFDTPELMGNKIFDPAEAVKVSHTLLSICYLHDEALKRGIEMVTSDVYLNSPQMQKTKALLVTHLHTSATEALIAAGARPTILLSLESPFIATRFHFNLKKYTGWFKHSFLMLGMRNRASRKTIYHQIFFPESYHAEDFYTKPFAEKKLLTMVVAAKRIENWKKNLLLKYYYGWGLKELNLERRRAIKYFSQTGDLDLYGYGWQEAGFPDLSAGEIKKVYRGTVEAGKKQETLSGYRFAICYENANMKGWVTEKIFDCLIAGCVPVYYGPPEITDYVPKGAFIDFRDFKDYAELRAYLKNMDEKIYNTYIENIKKYFRSEQYYLFSREYFAKSILDVLEQEFKTNAQS